MKSKLFIVLVITACLCLSACTERSTDNSQSSENIPPSVINDSQKSETKEEQAEQDQKPQQSAENPSTEEPTEEELIALLDRAMNDITHLATNDTADVLNDIFEGDIDCRYSDVDKRINIDGYDYQWTSRPYSDIVDYYSQSFTGEPLEWILASRFADVDGVLYCFVGGGATGASTKAVSIEKLEGNTYRLHYQWLTINDYCEEDDTKFSIEKTDAGYRISSIDYRPNHLERPVFKQDKAPESTRDMPGYTKKDLELFSLWLPESFAIHSNVIYEDDTELARKIAEITSVDAISDMEEPFVIYDQAYSDAETISVHKFGNYDGKSYYLQKEVSEGGMTGFQNTIIYCIAMENNVVVITFYPQRGIGGIYNQSEEFERILNSIE